MNKFKLNLVDPVSAPNFCDFYEHFCKMYTYIPVNFYSNSELYVLKSQFTPTKGLLYLSNDALKSNSVRKTEIKIATGDEVC